VEGAAGSLGGNRPGLLLLVRRFDRAFKDAKSIPPFSRTGFVVSDSAGQKLAYIYFEEEPGRRSARDEGAVSVPNSFC
jgi:hypothetical protein